MQFFDEFDPDKNILPETELSSLERDTIDNIISVVETIIVKAKEVKTYGEIYKIIVKVEKFMDQIEETIEGTVLEGSPAELSPKEKEGASEAIAGISEHMKALILDHAKSMYNTSPMTKGKSLTSKPVLKEKAWAEVTRGSGTTYVNLPKYSSSSFKKKGSIDSLKKKNNE